MADEWIRKVWYLNTIKYYSAVKKSAFESVLMRWMKLELIIHSEISQKGFPGGSVGKESACNAGDSGSIPGLGISPEGGSGNPLQYSCLEHPMDRGAWWATVHRVTKTQT